MRWCGVAIIASLSLFGCRRTNPGFGEAGTSGGNDSTGPGRTTISATTSQGGTVGDPTGSSTGSKDETGTQGGQTATASDTKPGDSSSGGETGNGIFDIGRPPLECDVVDICDPFDPATCPKGHACRPWGDPDAPDLGCFEITSSETPDEAGCASLCEFGGNDDGCGPRQYCDTSIAEPQCRTLCEETETRLSCDTVGSCFLHVPDNLSFYGTCVGNCDPLLETTKGVSACPGNQVCSANFDDHEPRCRALVPIQVGDNCSLTSCGDGQLCLDIESKAGECYPACDVTAPVTCPDNAPCIPLYEDLHGYSQLGFCDSFDGPIPKPKG